MVRSPAAEASASVPRKFPPCQRIERRERLVEQQQSRPLGEREGKGDLRTLAPRQRSYRPVQRNLEAAESRPHRLAVPARVEVRADTDVVLRGQPPVKRYLLCQETDLCQECRFLAGRAAEHGSPARTGRGEPSK